MSQSVDSQRIKKFRADRALLPYDDVEVAKRMQKARSNYSRSVNEGPITNGFLNKFYTAFEEELLELRKNNPHKEAETIAPVTTLRELHPILDKLDANFSRLIAGEEQLRANILRIQQDVEKILSILTTRKEK